MKMLHKRSFVAVMFIIAIAILFFTQSLFVVQAQDAPPSMTVRRSGATSPAQTDNLGVRYLKLGNSYREARNYDLAQYYIKRGIDLVRGRYGSYWEAVGYEYLGLLYRDMGDRQLALEYLRTAASLYDRIVNMRNGQGSDEALRAVIADVEQGASTPPPMSMPMSPPITSGISPTETRLQEENSRLQAENRRLMAKIAELEERIRQLEASSVMSLKSSASLDMSDCKRDLEGIAKYRESTLWMNGFAPLDFSTQERAVRLQGGNARVDGTVIVGYLKRGESTKIEITVPVGQYLILADGCQPKAKDIDVRIVNSQGVVLEKKDIRFGSSRAAGGASSSQQDSSGEQNTQSSSSNQSSDGQQSQQQSSGQQQNTNTQQEDTAPAQQPIDALPRKPSSSREALAKVGWSNEYGGTHTFLVTMYDCDNEGAYFCFLIGKK